ncbi:erlin-2 isoform X2 [Brachypodium distachyon]|uniref:erlin-2 isoform X2 n=1 Tax=Brachypodium distachyon TaxID=15368 RepID=UPI00053005C1|nr:erlin-2 isoform X2 [Brachypodium distachyon]|eukprot:XP_010233452.1 erlin-2 isoform X2 [Brachypodium distachyon]
MSDVTADSPPRQRPPPPPSPSLSQQQTRGRQPPPPGSDPLALGVIVFIAVCFLLVSISAPSSILHQVPEGHVGVYWRGGALLKAITSPGYHLKLPLITQFEPIQVTLQTDQVKGIPCGTKGGVMISFDKIEIDETMKEAIQRDCTRYAPGIEIISVRVTKPNIPSSIRRNFELMEEERTKALIAMERQKVAEKEAETQKKIALSEAEKNALVSKILMQQMLTEKDSSKRQQQIDNEMFLARERALTDANYYRITKEAEANKLKLTPAYLELRFIESIANNSKIFFGEKIPNMIMDQRMIRNYLDPASGKDRLEI